jgi:hypothetical protein
MPDQTFYYPLDVDPFDEGSSGLGQVSRDISFRFEGDLDSRLNRGVVCGCYAGKYKALTARDTEHRTKYMELDVPSTSRPSVAHYGWSDLAKWPGDGDDAKSTQHREDNRKVVDVVWNHIAGHGEPRSGLIVVAGATGSRKSSYARELARRVLVKPIDEAKDRTFDRPHVITFEDPIESWFAYTPIDASRAGFEYTPREKGKDVESLLAAINDALRQKPALLYVGEVRTPDDWRAILSFARTGHLAITTTHAGSLAETFAAILSAAQACTPAGRSEIANRIVAVLHVRKVEKERVPALWVQTDRTRTALTQEGLASLLPTGAEDGRYGRRDFAKELELGAALENAALMCDLRGE